MSPAASTPLSFREVLKLPSIRRLWAAQIVSIFGDFLAIYAVYSVVTFKLHGTATDVSLILVAYLLPLALVSPIAGALVDRWNIKRTMIASDLIRGGIVLLLPFATGLGQIYALFFLLSVVSSFFMPCQSITIRTLVPQAGLLSANALMMQAMYVMQIVSPAISGQMVAYLGANSCFWFDACTFVFSASMIFSISIEHQPAPAPGGVRALVASMQEGMRFIFTHAAISFIMIAMTAGMFAIRCFGALIAVYVRDVLHSGTRLFGNLGSLVGVGMIGGTQLVNTVARNKPKNHIVVAGLFGIGIAILFVASITSIPVTVIGMFGVGFCAALIMIPAQTVLQQETPRPMLGRVSSSMMSVLASAQVLAMLVAGPVAQKVGIRNLYFGSGVLLLLMALVGYRELRKPVAVEAATA